MATKVCTKCGLGKSLDMFYKGHGACKVCLLKQQKEYYALHREEIRQHRRERYKQRDKKKYAEKARQYRVARTQRLQSENLHVIPTAKICGTCKQEKPIEEFPKDKSKKDAHGSRCKLCFREYYRVWWAEHEEGQKERSRQYRAKHAVERRAYVKEYKRTHPEWRKAQDRAYGIKHKEQIRAYRRRRYKKHPELDKAKWHKRRARLANVYNDFEAQDWMGLLEKYGRECLACGETKPLTMDHIIPLSKNGPHTKSNIQPLCLSCNCLKAQQTVDYRPDWWVAAT